MSSLPSAIAQFDTNTLHAKPARAERAAKTEHEACHDTELVRRFKEEGDETAFAEIMERYRDRLFSVAYAMLKNAADAEEVAQDTFIRAHRALADFRGDCSLATWLHQIALNRARNRYWYHFRRRRHLTCSLDNAVGDDNQSTFANLVATEDVGPVRETVANEFTGLVATCMERLGPTGREILTLRNALNRSYIQIAEELGISVGTVKSRIARARGKLRVLLAETCPEFGAGEQPRSWFDAERQQGGIRVLSA